MPGSPVASSHGALRDLSGCRVYRVYGAFGGLVTASLGPLVGLRVPPWGSPVERRLGSLVLCRAWASFRVSGFGMDMGTEWALLAAPQISCRPKLNLRRRELPETPNPKP